MTSATGMVWCKSAFVTSAGPSNYGIALALVGTNLLRGCWIVTHSRSFTIFGNAYVTVITAKPVLCPWRDLAKETNP